MTAIANANVSGVILSGMTPLKEIKLTEESDLLIFDGIPPSATLLHIEGLLIGSASAASEFFALLNDDTSANYNYVKGIFAGSSASCSESLTDTKFVLSSGWGTNESARLNFDVSIDSAVIMIKSETYTSGKDTHHHAGWWGGSGPISKVTFNKGSILTGLFGVGTHLRASYM